MESILLKAKTLLFTIFAEKDMTNILGFKEEEWQDLIWDGKEDS